MRRAPIQSRAEVPVIPGVSDLTLIASGGSGVVYRGRQETLSRDVAVKVLSAAPDTSAGVSRWERELDAMGRLSNHPNIVALYDSGLTEDGRPYLVMPFIPGGSLGDRVRKQGPLSVEEAVPLGAKVALALAAAHDAGVLHRDVKPDNVLLSPYEPQLGDFGIARLVDAATTGLTGTGMITATVNYAAPEVLAGDKATEASDVYGLAATVYTALSGSLPFPHAQDANPIAVAHNVVHNPVPSLDGSVPAAVADVIAQGMAKDPADRPASAAAFGAALQAALADPGSTVRAPVVTTEAIPTVTTRIAEQASPAREPVVAAAPARTSPRAPGRQQSATPLFVGLVLVVLAAAAFLVLRDDASNGGGTPAGDIATPTTVAAPSAADRTADRTATTARVTRTTAPAAVASGPVAETARRYFTRLSNADYGGAYGMLSPAFQAAQSRGSFESFWRSASPVSITGDITADGMTARVPVRMGGRSNVYTLTMTEGDGETLYVDGPRPR